MSKRIFFILSMWLYFICEGITEAFTWMEVHPFNPDIYHIFRIGENLGVLGVIIMFGVLEHYKIRVSLLGLISGLSLYEMAYMGLMYNNILYNKTSLWLGIPHPKGWMWLCLFIASILTLIGLELWKKNKK